MAESSSSGKSSPGFVASMSVEASDEVLEFECSTCGEDGKAAEAVAYCTTCLEFLCQDCFSAHKRVRATKSHTFLEGRDLHTAAQSDTATGQAEPCEKHKDKSAEYFCPGHGRAFCSVCKDIGHRNCQGVKNLDDACRGFHRTKEATRAIQDVHNLSTKLGMLKERKSRNVSQFEEQKKSILAEVKSLRVRINGLLDKLENEMLQVVAQTIDNESTAIAKQLASLDGLIFSLERDEKDIKESYSNGYDRQLFVQVHKADLKNMQQLYRQMEREHSAEKFVFQPDQRLTQLLQELTRLGQIREGQEKRTTQAKVPPAEVGVVYAAEPFCDLRVGGKARHNVRDKTDKHGASITGCQYLPDGSLVLCDYNNSKLKLLNKKHELQYSLPLPSYPWNVAVVAQGEVVVTIPENNQLQFVKVLGGVMRCGRTIDTDSGCWGVAVHSNQLYVLNKNHGCSGYHVLVLDLQGQRVRTLGLRPDGSAQFPSPECIAVDQQGRVYVSDSLSHTVTCLGAGGGTVFTYRDKDLQDPRGLLVDSRQNVYVCGESSHNVLVMSRDGRKKKSLLWSGDGLRAPRTLTFRGSDRTLVIGMSSNDKILAFSFKYAE